ncbi:hypothetical protein [Vibrio sonorensis]|uniref:hypothetical protein n=1 Tax=Vibrio sonorensis TaxID=1004316 RepID=UPI0011141A33|nr:hypothetical protein [Vibrio sonorensis]
MNRITYREIEKENYDIALAKIPALKREIKRTIIFQTVGFALLLGLVFIIFLYRGEIYDSMELIIYQWIPNTAWYVYYLLAVALFGLISYKMNFSDFSSIPLKNSAQDSWEKRTNEIAPDCKLINVEVRTEPGKSKVIWRVKPSEVDFSDYAKEPIISYLIVER